MAVAGQEITFRTVDSSIEPVTALRGETPPKLTDGFGGWTEQERPKLTAATVWNGKPALKMDVAIMFDGYMKDDPVEAEISRLIRMSWPPKEHEQPPAVKVSGGTPGDTYTWVINDISFGDEQIWQFFHGSMVRYRQDAVVHLLQFVDIDTVAAQSPNVGGQRGHPRFYIVKQGDTLGSIAVKMYGKRSKWKDIAKANGIRDPKNIKVGQRLKIP
jgi:LysM repeat protein